MTATKQQAGKNTYFFISESTGALCSSQNSPVQQPTSWSPPMRQASADMSHVAAMPEHYNPPQVLQTYVDQYSYPQYSTNYVYDQSYLSQPIGQPAMYSEAVPSQQQDIQLPTPYYAPLDQYSRVQSVGDLKMATRELEMSRHGASLSQPDLSTASWDAPVETKYQAL